ncbi:MAG: ATP synthase F1 subunit epsilon [Patescibacteria group bacterium]
MFHLSVVTAERTIYDGDIDMLVTTTPGGEIGILTNHHPLVTKISPGGLKLTYPDKTEDVLFVSGGYLEVNNNRVIMLADTVTNIEDLQVEEAKAAKERAQELIKTAKDDVEREKLEEELHVQMAKERLAGIAQYKKRKL